MKIDLVVTRHPGMIEYLKQIGLANDETKILEHVTPDDVKNKHVCGVLPHSLSCLTKSFTEVPLVLPKELRGKELGYIDLLKFAKKPITYKVTVEKVHDRWI